MPELNNKFKITVTPVLFKQNNKFHLQLETKVNDEIVHKVIELEEEAVKEALIRIGWKSPDSEFDFKYKKNILEKFNHLIGHYLSLNHQELHAETIREIRKFLGVSYE